MSTIKGGGPASLALPFGSCDVPPPRPPSGQLTRAPGRGGRETCQRSSTRGRSRWTSRVPRCPTPADIWTRAALCRPRREQGTLNVLLAKPFGAGPLEPRHDHGRKTRNRNRAPAAQSLEGSPEPQPKTPTRAARYEPTPSRAALTPKRHDSSSFTHTDPMYSIQTLGSLLIASPGSERVDRGIRGAGAGSGPAGYGLLSFDVRQAPGARRAPLAAG
jgi:hypothetical protein